MHIRVASYAASPPYSYPTIDLLALLYANPSITMPLTYFATATLVLGGTHKGRPQAMRRACPSTEFGFILVPTVLGAQHT